ncbi:hypothetical protein ACFV6Z_18635 [Streptomyces sp. NPDC059818]|uniref:hypothetical protein n=1 Tax=Streptomyces sp. NPDC059818 TaxID=3346962 RepID=UPI00365E0FC0
MRTRTATIVTAGLLLTTLTACGNSSDDKPAGLTAQGMVDQLGDLYPLPNPRDNTSGCDTGKNHPNDCEQLITTDPVSVYELKTPEAAANWAKQMDGKAKNKAVQAGRFMLLWKAAYPSDQDAVAEMTAKAKELSVKE